MVGPQTEVAEVCPHRQSLLRIEIS